MFPFFEDCRVLLPLPDLAEWVGVGVRKSEEGEGRWRKSFMPRRGSGLGLPAWAVIISTTVAMEAAGVEPAS